MAARARKAASVRSWAVSVFWCAALVVALFAAPAQAGAPDSIYLKEMPAPERVAASFGNGDAAELAAERAGAMYQLRDMVWTLSAGRAYRNQLTADELKLTSGYVDAYSKLSAPIIAGFDPKETAKLGWNSPRAKWFGRRTHYEVDPVLLQTLLERFFSSGFREHFVALRSKEHGVQPAGGVLRLASGLAERAAAGVPLIQAGASPEGRIRNMLEEWWPLIALAVVALIVVTSAIGSYNLLQSKRQPIKKARSNVKIAIDRRCAAANDLAQIAQTVAAGEAFVNLQISQDSSGPSLAAAYQQSGALLHNVQNIAERYPSLKSNQHFLQVSQVVAQCEHEIAHQRQLVNHVIEEYNKLALQFPRVLLAKLLGFGEEDYVELDVSQARAQAKALDFGQADQRRLDHVLGLPSPAASVAPAQLGVAPAQLGVAPAQLAGSAPPALPAYTASPSAAPAVAARGGGTQAAQALPNVSLRFLSGPLGGRSVPIGAGCIVGREAPAAQVVVPDPQVSSAHAWIGMHAQGLVFVDRGSTNGSAVNGAPVRPGDEIPVKAGDVISLGRANPVAFVVEGT